MKFETKLKPGFHNPGLESRATATGFVFSRVSWLKNLFLVKLNKMILNTKNH